MNLKTKIQYQTENIQIIIIVCCLTIWIIDPVLNYGDHGKANNAIADAWAHSNYLLKQSEVIIQETENGGYDDVVKCHLSVRSRLYETSLKHCSNYASSLIQLIKSTVKHYYLLY